MDVDFKIKKKFCENCGFEDLLETFNALKPPLKGVVLCESCSWLPASRIRRKNYMAFHRRFIKKKRKVDEKNV